MSKLESNFQKQLIDELRESYPGCIIMKNDANYLQGIPDLLILFNDRWAMLEIKRSYKDYISRQQPNQEYYVDLLDSMSFAAFIFPENKEAVLYDLQQSLTSRR